MVQEYSPPSSPAKCLQRFSELLTYRTRVGLGDDMNLAHVEPGPSNEDWGPAFSSAYVFQLKKEKKCWKVQRVFSVFGSRLNISYRISRARGHRAESAVTPATHSAPVTAIFLTVAASPVSISTFFIHHTTTAVGSTAGTWCQRIPPAAPIQKSLEAHVPTPPLHFLLQISKPLD